MSGVDWKLLLSVTGLLWGVALTLWTRYVAAQSATKGEIEEIKGDQHHLSERVTRLETRIDQMPRADAVHKIEIAVGALEGDIKKLSATMEPIARSTRRIEDYLLREKSGK